MEKTIENFKLVSYDKKNDEHYQLISALKHDPLFNKYFGPFFMKKMDDILISSDELEIGKIYIVEEHNITIGIVRLYAYHEAGFIELQIAVKPSLRNHNYGSRIIKELTTYLFNNGIKCVSLDIDKRNIASIKCALNNGFKLENDKYRKRR